MENFKIITNFTNPPIPTRSHDWIAYVDGMEEDTHLYGYGETESEAIQDLKNNLYDGEII